MAWLYVPGLRGSDSDSPAPSPDTELSARLNGTPIVRRSWSRASRKAPYLLFLSGIPSNPLTVARGVAAWISSLPASPAPHSPVPEDGLALTTNAGSGPISSASYARSHPAWCSSKTCRVSTRGWESDSVAYAAGLIDGEGSITIQRNESRGSPQYALSLAVEMDLGKSSQSLNTLLWLFGGKVSANRKGRKGGLHAATAAWRLHGAEAACALAVLQPVLRTKRQQADLMLALFSWESQIATMANGKRQWTPERLDKWRDAYAALRSLNARGDHPSPDGTIAALVGDRWMRRIGANLFEEAHWETFSGPWPRSGSLRNGSVSRRPTWAPRTAGSGFSCWPTPNTPGGGRTLSETDVLAKGSTDRGKRQVGLEMAARYWPTPRTTDGQGAGQHGTGGPDLRTEAALWPTPRAADGASTARATTHGRTARQDGQSLTLTDAIRLWEPSRPDQTTAPAGSASLPSDPTSRQRLNPRFVAWLMGLPEGWVDLDTDPPNSAPSATPSSRSKLRSPLPNFGADSTPERTRS